MRKTKSSNGWTLKQGLAAQYAAQAGLDPELGAQAGEAAWDVLRATRDAVDEPNPQRQAKLAKKAFRRLDSAGLGRHRELVDQVTGVLNDIVRPETQARVNPKTGLQEFFGSPFLDREKDLKQKLDEQLLKQFSQSHLDENILAPKPEHTKEYWFERTLYNQGTPEEQAQRPLDAARQFIGQDQDSFKSLSALTGAVNRHWIPTGTTAEDIPSTAEQARDLYKSQGIDPSMYMNAPIAESYNLDYLARAKPQEALRNDPLLGNRMAASNPDVGTRIFIDQDGKLRQKIDEVQLDDPMYLTYSTLNDRYRKAWLENERQGRVGAGSGDIIRIDPRARWNPF